MGKKVRRNSKSRNTKTRNNLRRSKIRRNNSTKKARKQRRGSRKQRGGAEAPTCPADTETKLKESQKGEEGELIRVSILLTGLKKGTKITSQVRGRFKMADLASPQSLCDGFVIGYYDKKYSNLTLEDVINEINTRNFNEPHNGCFLKIIGNPERGTETLDQLATDSGTIIKVNTYLNPNSRYHYSQMYDPAKAQDLEDKIQSFNCGGELLIERVNITSDEEPRN